MIEILSRYENKVIHIVDADSLQDADLRDANLQDANLRYADLRYANLQDADLRYADLRYADLRGADLQGAYLLGASIKHCIGNGQDIKTLLALRWTISWTKTDLAIGCQQHSIEKWAEFSNEKINLMDEDALEFWMEYKNFIMNLVKLD